MASDSRSNAGVDQIARVHKMALIEQPGTGDLAHDVHTARTMFEVAQMVGNRLREVLGHEANYVQPFGDPNASFLVGGQIAGEAPRLFQIYSAGNFVEASDRASFLQI